MTAIQPIGIFDSGVGGLSIWKEIHKLLPKESTIYLADSKNAPYGDKPQKRIIEFSMKNSEALIKKGCKIIVVACNTATTNAISILRKNYNLPFIGIEPATKPAAINTSTGKIGILATKGTLISDLFSNTSQKYAGQVKIFETIGEGLVPIVESGNLNNAKPLLEKYLLPMVNEGVDNIVLGCTHYPFLIPLIKEIIPKNISIIDSGKAVAQQAKNILLDHDLLNKSELPGNYDFFTNSEAIVLNDFLNKTTTARFNISLTQW